jgi:hypothetical protein
MSLGGASMRSCGARSCLVFLTRNFHSVHSQELELQQQQDEIRRRFQVERFVKTEIF